MDSILNKYVRQYDNNKLLTWFLSKKSSYLDEEGPWAVSMIAKAISNSYSDMEVDHILNEQTIELLSFNYNDYIKCDPKYLQPVLELYNYVNNKMRDYLFDFLIHGSISTLDYVRGWSDLDTLVIIRKRIIDNHYNLIELRKHLFNTLPLLYKIDPLQHHGFIYCTESDLSQYSYFCLPIEVLHNSKSLFGNLKVQIDNHRYITRSCNHIRLINELLIKSKESGILKHHKYNNSYLKDNYLSMDTMYQMKYFLSLVMSLPAYYMDAKGDSCYKRESFNYVKDDFKNVWGIVERASKIRKMWEINETHPYKTNEIPQWLPDILGNNYFNSASELSNAMIMKLENSF